MSDLKNGIPPIEPTPAAPQAPLVEGVGAPLQQPVAYQYQQYAPLPPRRSSVLSILALIFGIVGVLGAWIAFIPFIGTFLGIWFPASGVVLGFIGRKREPYAKGMWLTGIILGFVGLFLVLAGLILWIALFATHSSFNDGFNSGFNSGMNT